VAPPQSPLNRALVCRELACARYRQPHNLVGQTGRPKKSRVISDVPRGQPIEMSIELLGRGTPYNRLRNISNQHWPVVIAALIIGTPYSVVPKVELCFWPCDETHQLCKGELGEQFVQLRQYCFCNILETPNSRIETARQEKEIRC
jgi:hypothetical protein